FVAGFVTGFMAGLVTGLVTDFIIGLIVGFVDGIGKEATLFCFELSSGLIFVAAGVVLKASGLVTEPVTVGMVISYFISVTGLVAKVVEELELVELIIIEAESISFGSRTEPSAIFASEIVPTVEA
ncbi:MAG: hypothetical protein WAV55_07540, partial [Clostridiaceae bacterium]